MADSSKAPIKFYSGFLENDWHDLPEVVRQELTDFLGELQQKPTDSDLLARCEVHKKEIYAYSLPDRYWLYFQIEKQIPGHYTIILAVHFRICVLDVAIV